MICRQVCLTFYASLVCFRNCRSWNPDASPPTSLGSAAKRPRSAALTSTNLECHLKSLPKDAESLSEPMPQESDAVSGNDDQTSGDSGTLGDQNYSSDNSHAHSSSVPESNLVLEQHIPLRIQDQPEKLVHGVSGVDEITSRSSGWKKCESGNLSHEDSCDNDEVNLSPAFENTFLPEQHDLVRIHDRSNELEDEVSALDRKASPASEWKQRKNANRVSLETLPATFGNGSVLKYAGMSADTNECDRLTTNNKFSSVSSLMKSLQKRHSRKNDSAVRLITPATNTQVTKMLVDIAQKIETQGSRRPQVAREQSLINGAMHSVVKPMKLDFQPETTQISSGRATLQEKEDGVQGTTNHHSRLLVPPSARKPEASTDHVAADDYRSTKCNHVSCPLTWKDYFPSIHDVFYGVHDIDDQVEATAAMLLAYECPDPPHSTLDSWLFHLGGYLFPDSNDDEECEASNGDIQSRNRGWYFFQVCFHDFFFGVHDELHHIEIPPYELSSIVMVNLCSLNSPLFSWFGELWDDAAAPIDSCEFFFFNWFLAIVCLLAFLPLLQHFADYLLLFDLPHDNTDVCHPERVGYWSSYACEYLPVYWVSYFIQAPK